MQTDLFLSESITRCKVGHHTWGSQSGKLVKLEWTGVAYENKVKQLISKETLQINSTSTYGYIT